MKTIDLHGWKIEAYTPKEAEELRAHGDIAQNLWFQEWKAQGGQDIGSCCGGKSLRVWYLDKGKRKPIELPIARCGWVQGNLSASRSVKPAIDYLASKGIKADYFDGWLD